MACIVSRPNSNYWVQYVSLDGSRQTIRLGKSTKRVAEQHKRMVEVILANQTAGLPMEQEVSKFLSTLSPKLRDRYGRLELIPGGQVKPVETLGGFLKSYLDPRQREVKKSTWTFYEHTKKRLLEYFGEKRRLSDITAADARAFRTWMETSNKRDKPKDGSAPQPLAANTIRRRTSLCRQIFRQAIEDGLITRNPFSGLPASVRSNRERQRYIPMEVFNLVLKEATSARHRALLLLARHAGFRMPSEIANLRWQHINLESRLLTVVESPKTAHHASRATRMVPISTQLLKELRTLHAENDGKSEKVFPEVLSTTNLRSLLRSFIRKAGVEQWPKLWQNLRSSASTDFARALPSHVAAAICGHTQQIAMEHYWTVTASDLSLAINVFPDEPSAVADDSSLEAKASNVKVDSPGVGSEESLEPSGAAEEEPAESSMDRSAAYQAAPVLESADVGALGSVSEEETTNREADSEAATGRKEVQEGAPEAVETSNSLGKAGNEWATEEGKWAVLDSNQRPPRCQRGALTN